ncbi:MAG: hypothetical protein ACETWT_06650, partial [Thermodesulfobacteriota bacterium]
LRNEAYLQYAAMTKDAAQRSPSALLRAVSMSNGSWTFYEAIILSEAKRPQIQCLSLKGEFWICSEASSRMVKNSFQGAKRGLGNTSTGIDQNELRKKANRARITNHG